MTRNEWLFTLLLATLGFCLVGVVTARFGPGVSSDSAFYLSAAENFARGKGFVDFGGGPLTFWPPLYPFLLGAIQWATGLAPMIAGRWLNALAVGLIIISAAWLFKSCFPQQRLWFTLGTLATALALFLYSMGANISSDLLFLWLVILFFLMGGKYLAGPQPGLWFGLCLIAASAAMLRWIGLALIVAGGLLILVAGRQQIKRALVAAFGFSVVALIPFLLWTFGRNYLQYGTLFGSQEMAYVSIRGNLAFTYAKIVHWFLPNALTKRLPAWILGLGCLTVILAINRKADWLRWTRRWLDHAILPVWLFSLIYLVAITLTVYTADHPIEDFYDDRYQSPLFFVALIGLFFSLEELILAHIKPDHRKLADRLIIIMFTIWAIYPLSTLYRFTAQSLESGVVAYNNYNTRQLNESDLLEFVGDYPFESGIPFYANYNEAVYLFTSRDVLPSPIDFEHYQADPAYLAQNYQDWPPAPRVYVIWFESAEKRNYFSPEQLRAVADIEMLYQGKDGQVAIARRR
jgi:hypothetical protein